MTATSTGYCVRQKSVQKKRLWRWDDNRRTNKRDVCASIQARFFYKTCYKFRVPWLVEIDLEHIIAVSTRDKLQLPSCELYTLTNDLLDPVQKIFAYHVACLPITPPPLLSGTGKKSADQMQQVSFYSGSNVEKIS